MFFWCFTGAKRLNSSCSDLTIISLTDCDNGNASCGPSSSGGGGGSLVPAAAATKQRVLPFIPPSFATHNANHLIKPSEYLRSISGSSTKLHRISIGSDLEQEHSVANLSSAITAHEVPTGTDSNGFNGPPPPPLPNLNTGKMNLNSLNFFLL